MALTFAAKWRERIGFDEAQFAVKAVDRRLASICVKQGSLVLDAGGGSGVDSIPVIAEKHARVILVDLSLGALLRAKSNVAGIREADRLSLLRGSVTQLPFRNGTFDAVTCFSVLDHLPTVNHVREALREFSRVLREHGRLAVTFPNLLFIAGTISGALHRLLDLQGFWERRFPPSSFVKMVWDAGFRSVAYDYGTSTWLSPMLRAYNLPAFLGRLPESALKPMVRLVISVSNVVAGWSSLFGPRFGILAVKANGAEFF